MADVLSSFNPVIKKQILETCTDLEIAESYASKVIAERRQ